jgi:hypothetical protein
MIDGLSMKQERFNDVGARTISDPEPKDLSFQLESGAAREIAILRHNATGMFPSISPDQPVARLIAPNGCHMLRAGKLPPQQPWQSGG